MATINHIATLSGSGSTLAVAPAGSVVAALSGRCYVWDDGELARTLGLPSYQGGPITFTDDGTALLGGHRVDVAQGNVETTAVTIDLLISGLPFAQRHGPRFYGMGPSAATEAGDRLIATHTFAPSKGIGDDETNRGPAAQVVLVDPVAGTMIAVLKDYDIQCLVDARGAFVAAATKAVSVWNADDGSLVDTADLTDFVADLRIRNDAVAMALSSGAVEVRSFESLAQPMRVDDAHSGGAAAVAVHPRLPIVATGGRDQQVKLWSTGNRNLDQIASFPANAKVRALAFNTDGDQLLIATLNEILVTELSGL